MIEIEHACLRALHLFLLGPSLWARSDPNQAVANEKKASLLIPSLMNQPLASNDHLVGVAGTKAMTAVRAASVEEAPSLSSSTTAAATTTAATAHGTRTSRILSFFSSPEGRRAPLLRQDSLFTRFGLVTVGEISSKDLGTVLWNGIGFTTLYFVIGISWFMFSNRWTVTDTVYFVVISLLTIGYGDFVVDDYNKDRFIDSWVIILGLVTLGIWAAYASRTIYSIRSRRGDGNDSVPRFDTKEALKARKRSLLRRLVLITLALIFGTVVFINGEADVDWPTSFYWAVVTSSTIGYGDVVPTTVEMKWFTIFYSMVSTLMMLETLRFAGAYPFDVWAIKAEGKVFKQFSWKEAPRDRAEAVILAETAVTEVLGVPPDRRRGDITRSDFALSMLLMLDRISYKDYQQAAQLYDNLDLNQEEGRTGVAGPVLTGSR